MFFFFFLSPVRAEPVETLFSLRCGEEPFDKLRANGVGIGRENVRNAHVWVNSNGGVSRLVLIPSLSVCAEDVEALLSLHCGEEPFDKLRANGEGTRRARRREASRGESRGERGGENEKRT